MTVIDRINFPYEGEIFRKNFQKDDLSLFRKSMSFDDVDYTDYRFEVARLDSFVNWPVPYIHPKKLAAAGFYYIGEEDQVKCFECHIVLCEWTPSDDIMAEHQRWSGRCRFVRNIPCGNVPIGVDPNTIPSYVRRADVCGLYGLKYKPYSGPDNDLNIENCMRTNTNFPEKNPDTEIGIFFDAESNTRSTINVGDVAGSEYSQYASYTRRLLSFQRWPKEKSQKKEDLAAAGFFYSGFLDETICYYCGIGLKSWEPTDDPVQEHIKWYSECPFIKKMQAKTQKNNDQCIPPETEDRVDLSRESKTSDSS